MRSRALRNTVVASFELWFELCCELRFVEAELEAGRCCPTATPAFAIEATTSETSRMRIVIFDVRFLNICLASISLTIIRATILVIQKRCDDFGFLHTLLDDAHVFRARLIRKVCDVDQEGFQIRE